MMFAISGYQITGKLYESAYSIIYCGYRSTDNLPVILKVLKGEYPTPEELAWFRQEYELTLNLRDVAGVITVYALEPYNNTLVMVLEDFGGKSLTRLLPHHPLELMDFLRLAIRITDILGSVHQQQIIHKNMNPSHIIWNPETAQVKIIDFGIASKFELKIQHRKNPEQLEGTLAYISPEQTGRMNRVVDYRSDLYSLGVTFYEMLTGQLPFTAEDAVGVVHGHIAKQPVPPHEINPNIPSILSEIVLKLMAKNAEDRYQSAYGLKVDLEWCLQNLSDLREISDFHLGRQDFSDKFSIPQKLYGREQELHILMQAFERVSNGRKEFLLVAGCAGVGKSVLVQEVQKPMTAKRGYFIAGKFDQFQQSIPYSAFTQAFNQLCSYLLTEPPATLAEWRTRILDALGNNGQVLVDIIPRLELVIGKQPGVPQVGPHEAQNRFNLCVQFFIRAISGADHPLIIFIDDLQWADSASLKLLQIILTDPLSQHLLVIGAYRDNEVDPDHPLMHTIEEIEQAETALIRIQVDNLTCEKVSALIADTLPGEDLSGLQALADLVYEKTYGNAFFVIQFLHSLYQERFITFKYPTEGNIKGKWTWDIEQICAQGVTDNVVELIAGKISKLALATQDVLKCAACVGNTFDLSTLSILCERSAHETLVHLLNGIEEGFIVPLDSRYLFVNADVKNTTKAAEFRFVHDRVQQAAYSLIEENQRQIVHLRIGRLLLANMQTTDISETLTVSPELEAHLFDITNHFNLASGLIIDAAEAVKIAKLNLLAGRKAKSATAYSQALEFLQTGIALLKFMTERTESEVWHTHYRLTLLFYEEMAESAYLSGSYEHMDAAVAEVLHHANTVLDKVKVYEVQIQAHTARNNFRKAVEIGLAVLKTLGLTISSRPTRIRILLELLTIRFILKGKSVEGLRDLPTMTDPGALAMIRVLSAVFAPALFSMPSLPPLLVCSAIKLFVKYGNAPQAPHFYAGYGFILCGVVGDIEKGYQFGQLSLQLLDTLHPHQIEARTTCMVHLSITPWKEFLSASAPSFLHAYHVGIETGDVEFAAYSALLYLIFLLLAGEPLTNTHQQLLFYQEMLQQLNQEKVLDTIRLCLQIVLNLQNYSENPTQFSGPFYHEKEMLPRYLETHDKVALFIFYSNKLQLCYLFQEYQHALEYALQTENYIDSQIGMPGLVLFYLYDSLSHLAVYHTVSTWKQVQIRCRIRRNQRKLKHWAKHAPMNYLHKYYLVEAERCRVFGRNKRAAALYEQAIQLAQDHKYFHEEALACELAGKFYLAEEQTKIAGFYLRDACYAYQRWQAATKARDLELRYPHLFPDSSTSPDRIPGSLSGNPQGASILDLESILRASQLLSGEIKLENLLSKMIQIVMENAGAESGALLLQENGEWVVKADTNSERFQTPFRDIHSRSEFPMNIIHYVARTQEPVVLYDATREGQFLHDPYVLQYSPKSVLCLPLINQGRVISLLYLENTLTRGAFTPERLEVLNLLSSQMAISIENAQLYDNLEQKVAERTKELESEHEKLQESERRAQALRDIAEKANQAKSEFLSHMSHELRTPLTAILGYTQLLGLDNNLIDKQREAIATIHRSGEHLLSLINGLLDLAKIEARKIDLNPVPVHLPGFLKSLVEMTRIHAQQKDITFTAEILPDLPVVLVDEQRLRQILLNLLNNAMKFTEQGNVTLRVARLMIDDCRLSIEKYLETTPNQQSSIVNLQFSIEDTGIGIPPQHLRDILLPFHQVENAQTKREGTGLGLAISQQLVRLMGSELHVKSTVGQGTIFWFDLQLPETKPDPILRALLSGAREKTTKVVTTNIDAESPENLSHQGLEGSDSSLVSECKVLQVSDESDLQVVPPQEILIELMESARDGRITNLRHVIVTLKTLNPQLLPFATRIEHLTENFQFEQIVEWLNTLMQETT